MNLDEALAVYLYLRNQVPGTRDERAYKAAWAIISHYAERTIGTGWCGTTDAPPATSPTPDPA